jgi:hypothetical protein
VGGAACRTTDVSPHRRSSTMRHRLARSFFTIAPLRRVPTEMSTWSTQLRPAKPFSNAASSVIAIAEAEFVRSPCEGGAGVCFRAGAHAIHLTFNTLNDDVLCVWDGSRLATSYPAGCGAFAGNCSAYALYVMLAHRPGLTHLATARCDSLSHCAPQGQHPRSAAFPAASSSRVPASHPSGSDGTPQGSPAIRH